MPNWQGSNRVRRLPPDLPRIRTEVLATAGHRCQHLRADNGHKCGLRTEQRHELGYSST